MRRSLDRIAGRLVVARRLLEFLWRERMRWMIPMVLALLLIGILLLVAVSTPLGPFIYTLF